MTRYGSEVDCSEDAAPALDQDEETEVSIVLICIKALIEIESIDISLHPSLHNAKTVILQCIEMYDLAPNEPEVRCSIVFLQKQIESIVWHKYRMGLRVNGVVESRVPGALSKCFSSHALLKI